eukprot:jgi/Botrbrau1/813/Bobra.0352s0010.1
MSLIGQHTSWFSHLFDVLIEATHLSQWPSETLLRAALQSGFGVASCHEEALSERLLAAGGQDLAVFALDRLGRLRFPIPWEKPSLVTQVVDHTFITRLAARGVFTRGLLLSRAVYTKDVALLEKCIAEARNDQSCRRPLNFDPALRLAVQTGWVRGAQLILDLRIEFQFPSYFYLLEPALEDPSLACLDMLRNSGLGDELCVEAVLLGRFDVLERLFQGGCSKQGGASVSTVASDNHASANWWMYGTHPEADWPDSIREVIVRRVFFSPGWQETPSARHTAYVASLIHAAAAVKLAPQIQQWRASAGAGALALLQWWEQQSEAYADRHGHAASSHMRHVLEAILEQAGFLTPSVQRRAEAIAAKMRAWLGLASAAYLDVH